MQHKSFSKPKVIPGRTPDAIPKSRRTPILLCGVFGMFFSVLFGLVLCLVSAGILYSLEDPSAFIEPVTLCLLFLSALAGGYVAARKRGGSFLLCGLSFSVFYLIFLFLVSLVLPGSSWIGDPAGYNLGQRGVVVLCALLGAAIASYKPHKRHSFKRK